MKKLTKENYLEVFQNWYELPDSIQKETYVYHQSYLSEDELYNSSFRLNIIIEINCLGSGPFKTVIFMSKLI